MSIRSYNFNTLYSDNSSRTNPKFVLDEIINGVKAVKLKHFMSPLTLNNIDSFNNVLKFSEVAGGLTTQNTCSIVIGQYNSSNITSAVQTALNSQGSLFYTVGFNTFANALTISQSTGSFTISTVGNSAYDELGLTSSVTGGNITGGSIDLSGIKQINIVSNLNATEVIGKNYNILASIPVEESLNTISTFVDDSADYIEINNNQISVIEFSLFDEEFRKVTPNKHWNLTLCFICD